MQIKKAKKKPIVIDAVRWGGSVQDATEIIDWILAGGGMARYHSPMTAQVDAEGKQVAAAVPAEINIDTLEGTMRADVGDWIIRGVKGEHYPCKPDVFKQTYDVIFNV